MEVNMKKKYSFTLIEVLVVLIVVAILAAIAIPIYTNLVEEKNNEICAAREELLIEAEKIFYYKYDTIPTSTAKLWRKYGSEALAVVWERKKKKGDFVYLAYYTPLQKFKYLLSCICSLKTADAIPTTLREIVADKSILKCPSDTRTGVISSYGIQKNSGAIADCDRPEMYFVGRGQMKHRHKIGSHQVAIFATLRKKTYAYDNSGNLFRRDRQASKFVEVGTGETEDQEEASDAVDSTNPEDAENLMGSTRDGGDV